MLQAKSQHKIILLMIFFMILNLSLKAQNHTYFVISGQIIADCDQMKQGEIQLIKKDNSNVLSTPIPVSGRFRLELDFNSVYELTFNQDGYLPKKVVVNTEVPAEVGKQSSNIPRFLMAVKLFKDKEDVANLYSGQHFQTIAYSEQKACFSRVPTIFDVEYVEKENVDQIQTIHFRESKSKLQDFQIF